MACPLALAPCRLPTGWRHCQESHPVMNPRIIAEAVGLFAITNVDDIVILALFFGRGEGKRDAARRVVAGQYLAFIAILAIAIGIAYGVGFLPRHAIAY